MASSFWKKTYDKRGVIPRDQVFCPICDTSLHIHNNHLTKNKHSTLKEETYVLDIRLKCHHCDYIQSFGVPLPKKYWEQVLAMRDGSWDWDPYESRESLKEELSRIGIKLEGVKEWVKENITSLKNDML